jgi:hypothetical protein
VPISSDHIPDHVKNKVADPAERRRLGPTMAERSAKGQRRQELKEQALFESYLRLKKSEGVLTYTHPRSDKATTIEVGHLDFEIRSKGRCLMLEFKAGGGQLTPAQRAFLEAEWRAGNPADVCYSAAEAIDLVRSWLNGEPGRLS